MTKIATRDSQQYNKTYILICKMYMDRSSKHTPAFTIVQILKVIPFKCAKMTFSSVHQFNARMINKGFNHCTYRSENVIFYRAKLSPLLHIGCYYAYTTPLSASFVANVIVQIVKVKR